MLLTIGVAFLALAIAGGALRIFLGGAHSHADTVHSPPNHAPPSVEHGTGPLDHDPGAIGIGADELFPASTLPPEAEADVEGEDSEVEVGDGVDSGGGDSSSSS